MTVGSLFSGIGGFDLGLERAGYEIAWQVENNDYCRKVLAKHWSTVPCHYDITTIDWRDIPTVDLVCGGFPCQPFSCAGQQRGEADDRYLWPEVVRCLSVLRPAWFLGENVPGLLHLGIDTVLSDLEALGYQTTVLGIPACGVDAPHLRQRLWIVAHTDAGGFAGEGVRQEQSRRTETLGSSEIRHQCDVAHAARLQPGREDARAIGERVGECGESAPLPDHDDGARSHRTTQEQGSRGESWRTQESIGGCSSDVPHAECTGSHAGAQTGIYPGEENRRARYVDAERFNRWLPEPAVGRVADGVPQKLDEGGLNEKEHDQKSGAAFNAHTGSLRDVRGNGESGAASSELCTAESDRDSMFSLSYQSGSAGRNEENQANEAMQSLRERLSSESYEESQHMQQRMPVRNRKAKRHEALGQPWPIEPADIPRVASDVKSRVDRLKGLGNAVVPQIVEALGRMILEAYRKGKA